MRDLPTERLECPECGAPRVQRASLSSVDYLPLVADTYGCEAIVLYGVAKTVDVVRLCHTSPRRHPMLEGGK